MRTGLKRWTFETVYFDDKAKIKPVKHTHTMIDRYYAENGHLSFKTDIESRAFSGHFVTTLI